MEEAKFEDKEGIFPARLAPILFTWNDSFDSVVCNGPSQISSCQIQLPNEQIWFVYDMPNMIDRF